MAIATSCTTHMGIVVVPDEASTSYVRVVMMFASSYPCTFTHLHQGLPPGVLVCHCAEPQDLLPCDT